MSVIDTIKNNPWKTIIGSTSSIITIIGALFTVDARYAHAADITTDRAETHKIIQETTINLRKQMIEDKLFELDVKQAQSRTQKLEPLDSALQLRYKRQLNELNQRTITQQK